MTIAARIEDGGCLISVQDTGVGIPNELRERVFDDYFQADNPNRDRSRGLGLGLAIVRRLVDLLDGTVHLNSEPGHGSTFDVRLPTEKVSTPVARYVSNTMTLPQSLAGKDRLLVVDDDPLIQSAFRELLANLTIDVRIAADPQEAIALVEEAGFAADVAIVDYRLPGGLDGLDVIERFLIRTPTLAAILMTGDLAPHLMARTADLQVALVTKPFDADKLALGVATARQLAGGRTFTG